MNRREFLLGTTAAVVAALLPSIGPGTVPEIIIGYDPARGADLSAVIIRGVDAYGNTVVEEIVVTEQEAMETRKSFQHIRSIQMTSTRSTSRTIEIEAADAPFKIDYIGGKGELL